MILSHRFLFALALVLALLVRGAAGEELRGDMVRLHVVAADDSDEAQALKLAARDACLAEARALLADCRDADAAWAKVNAHLEDFAAAAGSALRAAGCGDEVSATAGIFGFPDRRYGGTLVPAGRYRALRVVIGAGEGRNWWCVLYPSLCMPEEYRNGEPVRFHSVLWDWLVRLFGGGA